MYKYVSILSGLYFFRNIKIIVVMYGVCFVGIATSNGVVKFVFVGACVILCVNNMK